MIQLQGQQGGQAGNSGAHELQLEEELAEACSVIDEQVQQRTMSEPNLLNHFLLVFTSISLFTVSFMVSETLLVFDTPGHTHDH